MVCAVFPEEAGGKLPEGTTRFINLVVMFCFEDKYNVHVANDDTEGDSVDDVSVIADADDDTDIYNVNINNEVDDAEDNLRGGCG